MGKSVKLPKSFTERQPWHDANNSIWPVTLFFLRRNLDSRLFPAKLTPKEAGNIRDLLQKSLSTFQFLPAEGLSPQEKEILFEHFILAEGYEKQNSGRGFLIDESAKFLGIINLEDHLHLHLMSTSQNFTPPWKTLSKLEQSLSKELGFAYSKRFGYLTADPAVCGTGLALQAVLHIPALLHLSKFEDLIEKLPSDISLKGLGKEGSYLADFVLIENKYTLGVSEEAILQSVHEVAKKFETAEKNLRKSLDPTQTTLLKDKIARSFGLISNALSLQTEEALSSLSLIHLGKELGWIQKATGFNFFNLFFSSRRAHLSKLAHQEIIPPEQLQSERAKYLREQLSSLDPTPLFG